MSRPILAAVAAALSLFASTAMADRRDFTLVNNTAWPMYAVYISAPTAPSWNNEVLGRNNILMPSRYTDIGFSGGGGCIQDVRIVFSSEVDIRWNNVDLCSTKKMSVWYDFSIRKYQATWS